LLQNPYNITQLTLGMLLHYLGKLKMQIFCRYVTLKVGTFLRHSVYSRVSNEYVCVRDAGIPAPKTHVSPPSQPQTGLHSLQPHSYKHVYAIAASGWCYSVYVAVARNV